MKIATVWGVLPYIITDSNDGWGWANGPLVKLPEGTKEDDPLYMHEAWHVKQWYAYFGWFTLIAVVLSYLSGNALPALIIPIAYVIYRTDMLKERREIAAYGESLRALADEHGEQVVDGNANRFAKVMATSDKYEFDNDQDYYRKKIMRAYHDERLM